MSPPSSSSSLLFQSYRFYILYIEIYREQITQIQFEFSVKQRQTSMSDTRWHTYRYTERYIYKSASAREIKYRISNIKCRMYIKMNFRKGKSIKSRQTWFTGLLCCVFNINLHSDVLTTNCIIGKHLLTNDSEKTEQTSIFLFIFFVYCDKRGKRVSADFWLT